jgi:hypothetical protein
MGAREVVCLGRGPKTANVPRSEAKGIIDSRMSTENIYCFPKNPVTQSKKYYYV